MIRYCFLLLLLCFNSVFVRAEGRREFRQFTTDDGLLNNTVLRIAQDRLGRIWLATYDGLCYYDGFGFHTVRPVAEGTQAPLALGEISDVRIDSSGNVWTLFGNNHLIRLITDNGLARFYDNIDSAHSSLTIFIDSNGTFGFTNKEHAYRYDQVSDSFIRKKNPVTTLLAQANDSILAKLKTIAPDADLTDYIDSRNKADLWIATRNRGIYLIPDGNVDSARNYNMNASAPFKIPGNEVYCLLDDKYGNLWAGTKDEGICVAFKNPNPFSYIPNDANPDDQIQSSVRAISQDSDGNLWIGTYNSGILVHSSHNLKKISPGRNGMSEKWNWIRSIYQTRDNYIWVGTYRGLCRINPKTKAIKYWPYGNGNRFPTNGRIYSITEDDKGNLFLGEWGSLDYFDRSTERFTRLDTIDGFERVNVRKLTMQQDANLWVGTEKQGVFVLDTRNNKLIHHYSANSGKNKLVTNSIFDIYRDKTGKTWIGCFGGLNCIDPNGAIHEYKWLNQKIASGIIYRIFKDNNNAIWCSTPKGLLKIHPETKGLRIYDRAEINLVTEFSEGAAFQSKDSHLFFGGSNGLVSFYPDSLMISKHIPEILLESVSVNGKPMKQSAYLSKRDTTLDFSFWENNITLQLKAIQINAPGKSSIACKLVPYDKDFRFFDKPVTRVDYRRLPPGTYHLLVKSANADNVWSDTTSILKFSVAKPFWMEIYFWAAVLFALGLSIIIVSRLRIRKIRVKNQELEAKVTRRTHKVEKQKRQLQRINHSLKEKNAKISAQRDQILAQRDHLLEMHKKLEELNMVKQRFYMNISHDIRTPLSLIKLPVNELISSKKLPIEFKRKLEQIQRNSEYVIKLLDQVLDKKKLETGGLQLVYTHGNIVSVCSSVVQQFAEQARNNHQKVEFYCESETYQCRFDFDKLRQILFNLIANALKFTPSGGAVQCRLDIREEELKLVVTDNGIGIPADRIRHIFDRYYQVGKSAPGQTPEGSGIGLSLVNDFVQLLDGKILVESEEGKGSTFRVVLPLNKQKAEKAEEEILHQHTTTPESERTDPPNEGTPHILLVEDHDELREYLRELLLPKYKVTACRNGKEAIKFLAKKGGIQLILSDWMMPELDGIEFCKLVRKDARYQNIPFIILTALSQHENRKEALLAGVDDFISKPFDSELLFVKISHLMARDQRLIKAVSIDMATQPEDEKVETFNDRFLSRLKSITEKNMSAPDFGQAELASELGMSSTQFYRKLRELVQMTPTEFIRSIRIKRSKQLLSREDMTINEISDYIGFNDPKYFSRCFTKEVGVSPSKFRERMISNQEISTI